MSVPRLSSSLKLHNSSCWQRQTNISTVITKLSSHSTCLDVVKAKEPARRLSASLQRLVCNSQLEELLVTWRRDAMLVSSNPVYEPLQGVGAYSRRLCKRDKPTKHSQQPPAGSLTNSYFSPLQSASVPVPQCTWLLCLNTSQLRSLS